MGRSPFDKLGCRVSDRTRCVSQGGQAQTRQEFGRVTESHVPVVAPYIAASGPCQLVVDRKRRPHGYPGMAFLG